MELSATVLRGLQAAGSSAVSDAGFKQLATLAIRAALDPSDPADVPGRGRILTLERHIIFDLPPSRDQTRPGCGQRSFFSTRYAPT